MEQLISTITGAELVEFGEYYKDPSDKTLFVLGRKGNIIPLVENICLGKLKSLGNDLFYSETMNNNFFYDRTREIVVPLFLEDECSFEPFSEEAVYDGLSLVGKSTGKQVVIDEKGTRLTGLELLKMKIHEFEAVVVKEKSEEDFVSGMTDYQKKVYELSKKPLNDIELKDIPFILDGLGLTKEDEFFYNIVLSSFEVILANRPPKTNDYNEQTNSLERVELNKKIRNIIYNEEEPKYTFEEYQKPLDYEERIQSIGLSFLENGIEEMNYDEFNYLFNSVNKEKAFNNYEIDLKSLMIAETSLEYMKNLNDVKTR